MSTMQRCSGSRGQFFFLSREFVCKQIPEFENKHFHLFSSLFLILRLKCTRDVHVMYTRRLFLQANRVCFCFFSLFLLTNNHLFLFFGHKSENKRLETIKLFVPRIFAHSYLFPPTGTLKSLLFVVFHFSVFKLFATIHFILVIITFYQTIFIIKTI